MNLKMLLAIIFSTVGCASVERFKTARHDCDSANIASECRKAGIWGYGLNEFAESRRLLQKGCVKGDQKACRVFKSKFPDEHNAWMADQSKPSECLEKIGDDLEPLVIIRIKPVFGCSEKRDGYYSSPIVLIDRKNGSLFYAVSLESSGKNSTDLKSVNYKVGDQLFTGKSVFGQDASKSRGIVYFDLSEDQFFALSKTNLVGRAHGNGTSVEFNVTGESIQKVLERAKSEAKEVAKIVDLGPKNSEESTQSSKTPGQSVASVSFGTGFFVSPDGYVVTAEHVVSGAHKIEIVDASGKKYLAKVIGESKANDYAILKIEGKRFPHLPISPSSSVKLGEPVYTLGFPAQGILGTKIKYTNGTISSLAGLQNESSLFQISVPIHPGNSGGPLLNNSGSVIGLVSATARTSAFYAITGSMPQNIGWAVKSDIFRTELKVNRPSTTQLDVDEASKAVVQIICEQYPLVGH